MTEDERAMAVLNDLAGIVPCPACNWALVDHWKNASTALIDYEEKDVRPRFGCPNRECSLCCLDEQAQPLDCRKDQEADRWTGDNDE